MSNPYLGEVRMFGGNFAPQGWALCNGQILPISQNAALFSLLGTQYGGDGRSTFALPDLQGRVPISFGTGPGGAVVIGEEDGAETVTLTPAQAPAHSHEWAVMGGAGTADKEKLPNGYLANGPLAVYDNTNPATTVALASSTISTVGGSQPHENMAPFVVLNFIIALTGIFPSRN
jgi:microcystin-dependent protein